MIYDPLLKRDPKDGSLHPHLITEWKIINDTPGIQTPSWGEVHSGNLLNAESIRFTI